MMSLMVVNDSVFSHSQRYVDAEGYVIGNDGDAASGWPGVDGLDVIEGARHFGKKAAVSQPQTVADLVEASLLFDLFAG